MVSQNYFARLRKKKLNDASPVVTVVTVHMVHIVHIVHIITYHFIATSVSEEKRPPAPS